MAERYAFDLTTMDAAARGLWLDVYGLGFEHGIEAGRRQLEAEWSALHTAAAEVARRVAEVGPFDELADLRGQHDRAERQRAILSERGIA